MKQKKVKPRPGPGQMVQIGTRISVDTDTILRAIVGAEGIKYTDVFEQALQDFIEKKREEYAAKGLNLDTIIHFQSVLRNPPLEEKIKRGGQ